MRVRIAIRSALYYVRVRTLCGWSQWLVKSQKIGYSESTIINVIHKYLLIVISYYIQVPLIYLLHAEYIEQLKLLLFVSRLLFQVPTPIPRTTIAARLCTALSSRVLGPTNVSDFSWTVGQM